MSGDATGSFVMSSYVDKTWKLSKQIPFQQSEYSNPCLINIIAYMTAKRFISYCISVCQSYIINSISAGVLVATVYYISNL